ncbi:MAG: hypothetical protein O2912_12180 [Proteobacteria bacterium]|nr:hypothetical protein [Pseudomonadota bacterium]
MLKIFERAFVLGALGAFVALPLASPNIAVAQGAQSGATIKSGATVTPQTSAAGTQNATSTMSKQAEEAAAQGKDKAAEKAAAEKAAKEAMKKGK